ncbi:metallophosphoesterase family protein [Leuconostoc lactis]|uniref:metallophosphoesterase family protein n=1 Tax=Leuconostoc lactis TaxID=1246 RepID=UPI00242E6D87|nr:DNA repair exonuclease [Leuconostoc lactis]
MKFIHAADSHLGNPFKGLDRELPAALKQLVQASTMHAFEKMITQALTAQVDFLVIAGDLYSATENSPKVQVFVYQQFERLNQANIPVYLSFGNHDFEADQHAHLPWPTNVHVFSQDVATQRFTLASGERVALTGFSYQTPRQMQPVLTDFPVKSTTDDYHIGLYHGALGKAGDPYAPFTLQGLLTKRYDYWALGHIHVRQTLHEQPFVGYSGNLQGLNRKETGEKGYYLVTATQGKLVPVFQPSTVIRWEELVFTDSLNEDELLAQLAERDDQTPVFLTIQFTGQLDPAVVERLTSGVMLAKIRANLPANQWVVKLERRQAATTMLAADQIDQQFWHDALAQVLDDFDMGAHLPAQVPNVVREYYLSAAGKQALRDKMQQLLLERNM